MVRSFPLQTTLTMVDRITMTANNVERKMTGFSKRMQGNFRGINSAANRTNNAINRVGKSRVAQAGMAGLALGVGIAVREYVKFDDAIVGATSRFKDAQESGANVSEIMDQLRLSARKTGAETQFTAAQAAQGLDFFARAGFTSVEAMNSLRSVIDLTTASGEDFASVSDWSSDLLGAFGFAALESTKKVEKLKEMNAMLGLAVNSANVKMEDLFETLKIAAPVGSIAGASMKEMISITAVLGSAGIKGTNAATAMKNAFLRLTNPTAEVSKGLAKVGLSTKSFVDKEGNLESMTKIMGMIGERAAKLSKVEQLAVFGSVFGARAVAGAANLNKNSAEVFKTMSKLSKDPQKGLEKIANMMRTSLGNQLKILGSAATELSFKFIEAFDKQGKGGIKSLTDAIGRFDPSPIVKGLKATFWIIKAVYTVLSPLLPLIIALTIATKIYIITEKAYFAVEKMIIKYKKIRLFLQKRQIIGNAIWRAAVIASTALTWIRIGAQKAWMIISKLSIIGTWLMVAATTAWNVVTIIATAATWAFGAAIAFLTSPIFLIIAAIAILAIGAYFLIKNWTVVKEFFLGMWQSIKDSFWSSIEWIKGKFTAIVDWVANKWNSVKKFFGFAGDESTKLADATRAATINAAATIERGEGSPFAVGPEMFRSPATQRSENITTNRTAVDVNFNNMPDNAAIDRKGRTAPGTTLNLGVNPT